MRGYALFAYGFSFVGVRIVAGGLSDRVEGLGVTIVSMAVEAGGQALLWLANSPSIALIGAALTGCGCSLIFPSLGLEAFRRVPLEQRGIAIGVFAPFQDLAIGATEPLLGAMVTTSGTAGAFLAGTLTAAMGAIVTMRLQSISPGSIKSVLATSSELRAPTWNSKEP